VSSYHSCQLYSPEGVFIESINDFISLDCTLAEMQVGALVLVIPGSTHDAAQIPRGARMVYYRASDTALGAGRYRLIGQTTWLVARRERLVNRKYEQLIRLTCLHPNALLNSRIIPYDEGTAEADKTGAADDIIKAYTRENFLTATDTARNLAASRFVVEDDVSAAPSVAKAASYRTVLPTLQEIAASASAAGTYTGFEMYCPTEIGAYRLRTYIGQRGVDRSATSTNPLVLSLTNGALNTVELDEDWTEMVSAVYAGGSGKKDERLVSAPALDAALIAETPYGRIEWFQSVSASDDTLVLDDEAARVLREKRPRKVFTGDVSDSEYATFGEEYDWGDRVIGEYVDLRIGRVIQHDCRVDPVRITVERRENEETGMFDETETLDIRLRSET
jgi:hypothetical protein